MKARRKERVDHTSIDGADVKGSGANEQDFFGMDDARRSLNPAVVEVQKLSCMGEVFEKRLGKSGEKSVDAWLVRDDSIFERHEGHRSTIDLF